MATICILAKSRQAKDGACIPVLGQSIGDFLVVSLKKEVRGNTAQRKASSPRLLDRFARPWRPLRQRRSSLTCREFLDWEPGP